MKGTTINYGRRREGGKFVKIKNKGGE